jgi:cytochrome P450
MSSTTEQPIPQFTDALFEDEVLIDSSANYKAIRDAGDVVWSPELDMYLVARFEDVKNGLWANKQLISSEGVTLNPMQNGEVARQMVSTIQSDGDQHKHLKKFVMKPLTAVKMKALKDSIMELADAQVQALLGAGTTEGMTSLAFYLPVNVVCDLVGINGVDSVRMQDWSEAAFNSTGPAQHPRTLANMHAIMDFRSFLEPITRADVKPGSWSDDLFLAAEAGDITIDEARSLMGDYIVPSLDTTAQSTAEMLYRLAQQPEALDKIRSNPDLVSSTVLESVRLASPIRGFSRYLVEDFQFSETRLPKGSRVWLINAAANRDERHYADPETFDIERNPKDQLGWGYGVHLCIGKHLAQLEMESLLRALAKHVKRIEIDEPQRLINNMIQGYRSLPVRLIAA